MISWNHATRFGLDLLILMLHGIGLNLLITQRNGRKRNAILINISLADALFAVLWLTQIASGWAKFNMIKYISVLKVSTSIILYYSLCLLSSDRFLEVYMHLNYRNSIMYSQKILLCLLGWGSGVVVLITLLLAQLNINSYLYSVYLVGDILVLVVSSPTYIYLYIRYRKSNRQMSKSRLKNVPGKRHHRFWIPCMIVLSFVLFFAVPDIIVIACRSKNWKNLEENLNILNKLNFICDAVIYIFLQPSFRMRLRRKLRWKTETLKTDKLYGVRSTSISRVQVRRDIVNSIGGTYGKYSQEMIKGTI